MKLSMPRPSLKSIEFEPIGRRQQAEYEKELIQIENHVLGGDDDDELVNDAFMEGNNVDAAGKAIRFKMVTKIKKDASRPSRRVVEIDPDDLPGLAKYQGEMRKNENLFKNFEFSGNAGATNETPRTDSKIPPGTVSYTHLTLPTILRV